MQAGLFRWRLFAAAFFVVSTVCFSPIAAFGAGGTKTPHSKPTVIPLYVLSNMSSTDVFFYKIPEPCQMS